MLSFPGHHKAQYNSVKYLEKVMRREAEEKTYHLSFGVFFLEFIKLRSNDEPYLGNWGVEKCVELLPVKFSIPDVGPE